MTRSKDLRPGDLLRYEGVHPLHAVTVRARKETNDGWWLDDPDGKPAGGIADFVFDESRAYTLIPRVDDAPDLPAGWTWASGTGTFAVQHDGHAIAVVQLAGNVPFQSEIADQFTRLLAAIGTG